MTYNILDDVISGLQPEELPAEYIILAKVIDINGVERVLRGNELEKFMRDPNRGIGVAEARVILDVRKIREVLINILTNFFDELQCIVTHLPAPDDQPPDHL